MSGTETPGLEVATLGGGCFWCLDAVFRDLRGVAQVHSGYAGGHVANPTYEQVCGKRTGHAEVVQVDLRPDARSPMPICCGSSSPSTTRPPRTARATMSARNTAPSSCIHSPDQRAAAEAVMAEITAAGIWGAPLVTELVPFERFWPGEAEHQDYFTRTPWSGYCRVVIAPKVAKFRKIYADRLKRPAA